MKYNIYILLFILSVNPLQEVFAQNAPGLAGKRFSVFYNIDFAYNMLAFTRNAAEKDLSNLYIDEDELSGFYYQLQNGSIRHVALGNFIRNPFLNLTGQNSLQVDYAISRIRSIGVGISYFRNGYGTVGNVEVYSKNLDVVTSSFYIKKYKANEGSIAPLGAYRQWGFHFVRITDTWKENSQYFNTPESFEFRPVTYMPGISYTIGKQTILAKDILVNYGLETGLNLPLARFGANETYADMINNIFAPQTAIQRLALFNLIRLKVGVGLAPM